MGGDISSLPDLVPSLLGIEGMGDNVLDNLPGRWGPVCQWGPSSVLCGVIPDQGKQNVCQLLI